MALIALFAPIARPTNRSTAAAPDPFVLLLYVTLRPSGMSGASGARGPAECDPEHN